MYTRDAITELEAQTNYLQREITHHKTKVEQLQAAMTTIANIRDKLIKEYAAGLEVLPEDHWY